MTTALFAPRPRETGATYDELRRMAAELRGFHYRHGESMALLARFALSQANRFPAGLDGIMSERLDDGWSFAWNGTTTDHREPAHTPWSAPPIRIWPRHCMTFVKGLPYGYWSDQAGWQDSEARWLHALEAHVVRLERQPKERS